jgi:hypothetical protein
MKTTIISIRIVALFSSAILISFIPEQIPDFFGDWTCKATSQLPCHNADPYMEGHISPILHWGYRHYLFFIMGVVLFIIQAVSVINYSEK